MASPAAARGSQGAQGCSAPVTPELPSQRNAALVSSDSSKEAKQEDLAPVAAKLAPQSRGPLASSGSSLQDLCVESLLQDPANTKLLTTLPEPRLVDIITKLAQKNRDLAQKQEKLLLDKQIRCAILSCVQD